MNLEIENLIFKKNYDPTSDIIKILENLDYKIGIIKRIIFIQIKKMKNKILLKKIY